MIKEWLEPEEHILTDGEKIGLHNEREEYAEQVCEAIVEDFIYIDFDGKEHEFRLDVVSVEINDEEDTYDIDVRYECTTNDELYGTYHFDELEFGCSPAEAAEDIRDTLSDWIEID